MTIQTRADKNDGAGEEFLAFRLGREEYGIDILKVQEIRGYESVTQIANAPDYLKGVINLRGTIVPIVDLRVRFRLGEPTYNDLTVVIILSVARRVVGVVVDSVSDVLELTRQHVKPAPEMSGSVDTRHITGIANVGERMLILMDIEALMASPEMGLSDQ